MTSLEQALLALAKKHPRIFRRIADAYRLGIAVDDKTAREFQRLEEVRNFDYSAEEMMLALATVCKTMIEHEGERV